ncbi:MAG: archaeosine biosynthesis radical SAM protein RaSEA [Thermoplasmata archaeon]|nr:archaeosine biosynthesis radical SAM protein RaSEA [Thermoplasmata archaeon]
MGDGRTNPVSFWKEDDRKGDRVVETATLILDTPGCYWSEKLGCSMCGYNNNVSRAPVDHVEYIAQIDSRLDIMKDMEYIKIFTSGSFFDENEIPLKTTHSIIKKIHDISPRSRILVESRPEFITEKAINDLGTLHDDIEVAIGLETTDDNIRSKLIRKGFTYDDFIGSAEILLDKGFSLKSYLLMKPPFMDERNAISDMVRSIRDLIKRFPEQTISINPMNIQKRTVVERLYQRGLYRTPWIWSLTQIIMEVEDILGDAVKLMSSPTGGGRVRGAHNCGKCDKMALDSIQRFSLSQDISQILPPLDCCESNWMTYKENEIF